MDLLESEEDGKGNEEREERYSQPTQGDYVDGLMELKRERKLGIFF